MGKRTNFEKKPRDFYATPRKAVEALIPHLPAEGVSYVEPCAGDGKLVEHLEFFSPNSLCVFASDLEPQVDWVIQLDAKELTGEAVANSNYIITNPPFSWDVLASLMGKFISLRPTILLLPADMMHNVRFRPYLNKCYKIVSIGRVKWFEGSSATSLENFAWFFFKNDNTSQPQFYGKG